MMPSMSPSPVASDVAGVSVAHVFQEVEDGLLEVLRWDVVEGVEEVGLEAVGLSRSEWRGVRSEGGLRADE